MPTLSLVDAGTWIPSASEQSVATDGEPGGGYIAEADCSQVTAAPTVIAARLYSKVMPTAPLTLHKQGSLGPFPFSPQKIRLGPVFTTEGVDFRLQLTTGPGGMFIPWRLYQAGRASSRNAGVWTSPGGITQPATVLAEYEWGGNYLFTIDASQVPAGSTVVVCTLSRCGAGQSGAMVIADEVPIAGPVSGPAIFDLGPAPGMDGIQLTIQQTVGTGVFPIYWSAFQLGTI